MVIELKSEEHEFVAGLLKGLTDSQRLRQFSGGMDNEHCPYQCMCFLEEDLLNFEQEHPGSKATEGWYFCLGRANTDKIMPVPEHTGYTGMKPWMMYVYGDKTAIITIEEGYGLSVWDVEQFYEMRDAVTVIMVKFAEDSGMALNAANKVYVECERAWMSD